MKFIAIIYAIIICLLMSCIILPILVVLFPISIIAECIFFIKEAITEDKYVHGSWITLCKDSVSYIKEIYSKINNHDKD